jgi:catechol 2,3-dioxygenase-like lactoylglutathione lyase family enzyme
MIKHFDHVTIVVRDTKEAKAFFALLGFVEQQSTILSGERASEYMDIAGIEADHVTLVLAKSLPHLEVQLLRYHRPDPIPDPDILKLNKLGFNHICFAVDDIEAEVRNLRASGVEMRNEIMQFLDRKLVFLSGPEGVTVELAQWMTN